MVQNKILAVIIIRVKGDRIDFHGLSRLIIRPRADLVHAHLEQKTQL